MSFFHFVDGHLNCKHVFIFKRINERHKDSKISRIINHSKTHSIEQLFASCNKRMENCAPTSNTSKDIPSNYKILYNNYLDIIFRNRYEFIPPSCKPWSTLVVKKHPHFAMISFDYVMNDMFTSIYK